MKKVLIAEDDNFLANAYRVKLEKSGFDLKLARDGVEAITILQTFTPDVIVLDLVMPNKDGFATLEEIKKHPEWQKIPVLVASNLGQKEDIDRATQLGAAGYLIKSNLTMAQLVEKIDSLRVE
jgi:two-component system, OmpR family, alkaline phosphatase synthesis response regulator PhoP